MSSWLYKLRRRKRGEGAFGKQEPVAPAPSPCSPSPNRASYYVPSRDRERAAPAPPRPNNPKLRDTHFPQPSDIVFDVVVGHSFKDDMPELKLRPILTTRPSAASPDSSSAAARVRPRFHAPPSRRRKASAVPKAEDEEETCARRRRRRSASRQLWMCESLVVVKESAEPEEDFLESMAEMIAANAGVRSPRGLQDLLACYLALNAPDHHRAIVAAFRRAWLHLHSSPAPVRGRCMHEARLDLD